MGRSPIPQIGAPHFGPRSGSVRALISLAVSAPVLLWVDAAQATTTPGTKPFVPHESQEAGRWSLLIAAVGLLVVLPFALWFVGWLIWLATGRKNHKPLPRLVVLGWVRGAIVGADKRASTSKTAAVVWTYSLATALLSIVIVKWLGHPHALQDLEKAGLQAQYGVLIGGTLGAAIAAKGIVSTQVASGQSKPDA